jgi:tetratricopeptide (TPR) repeat protein
MKKKSLTRTIERPLDRCRMAADERSSTEHCSASVASVADSWFGGLGQSDFEIDFYERILARQPSDLRMLRQLGELYARQGRFDRALGIDHRLVQLLPDDPIALYNLACSLSMQGETEKSLEHLGRALDLGYNDFSHLEIDPDLDSVRQTPHFAALVKQYVVREAV